MKKLIFTTLLMTLILALSSSAQMADQAEFQSAKGNYLGIQPATKPFALIDLSKFKWIQSYSLSYFSGAGSSGSMGYYSGTLLYEISSALTLNLNVGIAHNPGSLFNSRQSTDAKFFPGFNLDYHPSDKFRLSIGVQSYPSIYYNPYMPYSYSPWR